MKNILIATDFSVHSKRTIKSVLDMIKENKNPSQVTLLNTYLVRSNSLKDDFVELNDKTKAVSKKNLEEEQKLAAKMLLDSPVTIQVSSRMGTLENVIHHLIQNEKYDLIAMGKDGGENISKVSSLLKKESGPPLLITY